MPRRYDVSLLDKIRQGQYETDYEGVPVLVKPIPDGGEDGEIDPRLYKAMRFMPLLCLLPKLSSKLEGKQTALFLTGFIWAALVALPRIIMGAHYLTDTMAGFAVGLISLIAVCACFPKLKKISNSGASERSPGIIIRKCGRGSAAMWGEAAPGRL